MRINKYLPKFNRASAGEDGGVASAQKSKLILDPILPCLFFVFVGECWSSDGCPPPEQWCVVSKLGGCL